MKRIVRPSKDAIVTDLRATSDAMIDELKDCQGNFSRRLFLTPVLPRPLFTAVLCLFVQVSLTHGQTTQLASDVAGKPLNRILFGSCVKQDQPMPIFKTMLALQPDLVLFLGDNIYADTLDMKEMRAKYDLLRSNRDFAALEQACPIVATWDDHDYGINDGGSDYPRRKEAQREFLRFWRESPDSPRWRREGIYDASTIGPLGQRVQIILLDTRYFRSPLKLGPQRRVAGPYVPDDDPAKTMLGEAQWQWLEEQLKQPAELRILVTSVQCIPEAVGQETWSNLPRERQRLFDLIRRCNADGVVLVSGDRHWAELSKLEQSVPYPLYEMTSSSFNQIHPRGTPSENRFRASDVTYHQENFGVIEVDWQPGEPNVTLQLCDLDGKVHIEQVVRLSELRVD